MNYLQFKNEKVFRNFVAKPHHPNLIEVLWYILEKCGEVVVTSAYRYGDRGVHGTDPLRAVDLRSWIYSDGFQEFLLKEVNETFTYDPQREKMKVMIKHNVRDKGIHFHCQVSSRTVKNGIGESG